MPKETRAPKTSLREAQKDMTRRRILEAARKLFGSVSFEQASMEDVAGKAEVGRTTIYFHYPTKNALLIDLLREDWDRQAVIFEQLAATPEINRDSLRGWLERFTAGMRRSRTLFRLYGFTLSLNEEVGTLQHQHRDRLIGILAKRIPAFATRQGAAPGRRKAAAASHMLLVQIEHYGALLAGDLPQHDADAATDAMLDAFSTFIASAAAPGRLRVTA
jgi:AcrR family transcriptional regulator